MSKYTLLLAFLLPITVVPAATRAQTANDADFDGNGRVGFTDFLMFAKAYGSTQADYDLNQSGKVDFTDFLSFARFYGQAVSPSGSHWTTYTTADGLAYDAVGAIALAPDGGLWCAHPIPSGGISHFNGEVWTHYALGDGLASAFIGWGEPLAITPEGVVWVGTFDSGVSCFDGQIWKTYTTRDGLLNDAVWAAAVAPNGDVWFGHPVANGGLSRFDGQIWTTYGASDMDLEGANPVMCICVAPDGALWVGGSVFGVCRFAGGIWTHFTFTQMGLAVPVVECMAVASDGTLWVGGFGASRYDGKTWTHHSLASMGVTDFDEHGILALDVGPDDALWAATEKQGVFRYDGQGWANFTQADGLAANGVMAIAAVSDGALWFGTEAGLSRYIPGSTMAGSKRTAR